MKKQGFTLAEVLITLAIIGIVAAITLPGLNNGVNSRKVGPALAKAVNNLENANRTALVKQSKRTLEDLDLTYSANELGVSGDGKSYLNRIAKYMQGELVKRGSATSDLEFISKDGISYKMHYTDKKSFFKSDKRAELPRSKYEGNYFNVLIDVNGGGQPNKEGEDRFLVHIDNFGIVIPAGGVEADDYGASDRKDCTDDGATIDEYCTGTIADAGWEVRY